MKNLTGFFGLFVFIFFFSCGSAPEEEVRVPVPSAVPVPASPASPASPAPSAPAENIPAPLVELPAPVVVEVPEEEDTEEFDVTSITLEERQHTFEDIRDFINELNLIIRRRDYDGWVAHLSPSYLAQLSSPEFLLEISRFTERLQTNGIVLSTPRDYFLHVVVPSRTYDRVDDIEYITRKRVKAYTIRNVTNERGQRQQIRLRLYDLENQGNGWRIVS